MVLNEVLKRLKYLGTGQNRKIYKRHGAPDNMYGVSLTNLYKLKRIIKTNHTLAIQLWNTEVMDARCLATMIADPKLFSQEQAQAWTEACTYHVLADLLAHNLLSKCSFAQGMMEELIRSEHEYRCRVGWKIMENLATKNIFLPDAYFIPFLEKIKTDIHQNKNRSREAMNSALIAIGKRNENMHAISLNMAHKMGKVKIDHGKTSCKTPDAYFELMKIAEVPVQNVFAGKY